MGNSILRSIQKAQSLLHRKSTEPEENTATGQNSYLIVGLGNPGREYRNNRHNVGFMTVDRISGQYAIPMSRVQFKAITGSGNVEGMRLILAKPQTYMNLSGESVSSLLRFYKIPLDRLLVIHDDLDIPFGHLRIRPGGGPGGQKGVKSIIDRLGTRDFPRLRIGIGRPPGQMSASAYVLEDFIEAEHSELEIVLKHAVDAAAMFIRHGLDQAMNEFNGSVKE